MHRCMRAARCVALGLALASCDFQPDMTQFVAFTYSGVVAGAWEARGAPNPYNDEDVFPRVGGVREADVGIMVYGVIPLRTEFVNITFPLNASGTVPIAPDCNTFGTACTGVRFSVPRSGTGGTTAFSCSLTSGSITVTALSKSRAIGDTTLVESRAIGQFSGTGTCLDADDLPLGEIVMSDGAFNVTLHQR